jgi:ferredoxin
MGRLIYLKNVVTLQLEEERCVGCGICAQVCPQAVLALEEGRARIRYRDSCMECGACARNCPAGALNVRTGVGCAAAVINAALGRKSACCTLENQEGPPSGGCC